MFLGKGALKIYSKFTGEHPWRSANSIKLLCNLLSHFQNTLVKKTVIFFQIIKNKSEKYLFRLTSESGTFYLVRNV